MNKPLFGVLLAIVLFFLAACGPPAPDEDGADEVEEPTATTVAPVTATVVAPATATPEAYPLQPAPTPVPDDYPAAPATIAPPTAYPADERISILRPLGNQCQDEEAYRYATLEEAVTDLEEAGVEVFASEMTSLMVCEACDCPTSEHFQAEILRANLTAAQALGWYQGRGE